MVGEVARADAKCGVLNVPLCLCRHAFDVCGLYSTANHSAENPGQSVDLCQMVGAAIS